MFDLSMVRLEQLVIHRAGNKTREEGMVVSPGPYELLDGNVEELLLKYLLSSFREKVLYQFYHETDLHQHPLYLMLSNMFIRPRSFYEESVNVLQLLYEKSLHPQIRGGEFYLTRFANCQVGEATVDAIGLFKTEKREKYLKVDAAGNGFWLGMDQGVNVRRLDKGAIIFNTESPNGYRVAIVDNVSKGRDQEASYWKEDFLGLTEVRNEYFHTEKYLDLCQDFAENVYGPVYQADKKDKVVFMNEAIAYFDKNPEFQLEEFVQHVVKSPELIEQFKEHKGMYEANQGLASTEAFAISGAAVKTVKRKFKNLIKLDTDIEIKVKSPGEERDDAGYIERGYDETKGMHFYKVYFNEEE